MKNYQSKVNVTGGFWKDLEEINRNVSIETVWDRFDETGRIGAFKFDWKEGMENKPHIFWDSDVFKWMEGAANIIAKHPSVDLEAKINMLLDLIEKNQKENGYFNIYYTVCEPDEVFKHRFQHELYCAGHMFEAAVAHFYATGSRRFLNIACRYADCIERAFVTEKTAAFTTPGHEEIELALVRLYQATGEKRYLDLCAFFINKRGISPDDRLEWSLIKKHKNMEIYSQDNVEPRKMEVAVGHAVRCLYLLSGMVDCAVESGDEELMNACRRVYDDITTYKMYITGGTGSHFVNEDFTVAYDLPNDTAYTETCASIALALFANRMAQYECKAKYADTVERVLYNGVLSGISLDGSAYFYENPLEIRLGTRRPDTHYPITERVHVFECSCCPPNLNRTLSSLENFIYNIDGETCFVNQFIPSVYNSDGYRVEMTTEYPHKGAVKIASEKFKKICVRIPEWCDNFTLNHSYTLKDGYAVIENDGKDIMLEMEIKPQLITANSKIPFDAGKVAVQMGPIVYCAEAVDNKCNIDSLFIKDVENAEISYDSFFHANVIDLKGYELKGEDRLYSRKSPTLSEKTIRLIPYYGFANRGSSDMSVWLGRIFG